MKTYSTIFLFVFMLILVFASNDAAQTSQNSVKQNEWIAKVLKDVQTIKVGMTRRQMRMVFGEEGGISSTSHRTYVYLGCPDIKVDFEYESRGPEIKDASGTYRRPESDLDVIKTMSKRYLEFSIID